MTLQQHHHRYRQHYPSPSSPLPSIPRITTTIIIVSIYMPRMIVAALVRRPHHDRGGRGEPLLAPVTRRPLRPDTRARRSGLRRRSVCYCYFHYNCYCCCYYCAHRTMAGCQRAWDTATTAAPIVLVLGLVAWSWYVADVVVAFGYLAFGPQRISTVVGVSLVRRWRGAAAPTGCDRGHNSRFSLTPRPVARDAGAAQLRERHLDGAPLAAATLSRARRVAAAGRARRGARDRRHRARARGARARDQDRDAERPNPLLPRLRDREAGSRPPLLHLPAVHSEDGPPLSVGRPLRRLG